MALNGSPAVHQSVQFGQSSLRVPSSPSNLLGVTDEPPPLCSKRDVSVEPFACVYDTTELGDQVQLAHLVHTRHAANKRWRDYQKPCL
jgi:hypothetical protein